MKLRSMLLLLIGGLFILQTTSLTAAEIYRWRDDTGKTHYSTNPPSHKVNGPIEVKRNNRWYRYTGKEDPQAINSRKAPINYTTSFPAHTSEPPESESPDGQAIVPYYQQNSVIIVDVTINNSITRPFAVDTGASYTVISPEIASELYITPAYNAPDVTLQTANGRIQVPLINLDSLKIGTLETPNVTAAVHSIDDSSNISGLLGLNMLSRFQMTVDSTEHQLIFKSVQKDTDYKKQDCVRAREQLRLGRALDNASHEEISYYQEAISLCPDLLEAYYYLGAVYIHQKKGRKAVELHRKIISMQPDEAEAHFRLGISYMLQHEFRLAKTQFERALRLNPDHQQAADYLKRIKKQ